MENRIVALEQRFGGVENAMTEMLKRMEELSVRPRRRRAPSRRPRNGDITDDEDSPPRRSRSRSIQSGSYTPNYRGGRRKLEIPVFSGDYPYGWLVRVERYFWINGVREREKLDAVVIAMEGRALNWFQWWEERAPLRTWEEFKVAVKRRFCPGALNNPLGPLLRLKQEGTVMEYREKFELHLAPLNREERVLLDSIFLNGLKEELQAELKMYEYDDLADLMDMALLLEEKNLAISKKNGQMKEKTEWKGTNSKFRTTWGNTVEKKEGVKGGVSNGEKKEGFKGHRLSSAELEERHKKGLF